MIGSVAEKNIAIIAKILTASTISITDQQKNIYNIDKEYGYSTIKATPLCSLEKILKQEALKNASNIPMMYYLILKVSMIPTTSKCFPNLHLY